VLADADVDAANLELLLAPKIEETFAFTAGQTVEIDKNTCIQCGTCEEVCRFNAVLQDMDGMYKIDPSYCEGCLACLHQCPVDAITSEQHQSGEWYRSTAVYGPLFHANLYPGEENSGKLVTQIKTDAQGFGKSCKKDLLFIDGPPGIGCPVTAACNGVDVVLIVSEPTVSGFHDMKRMKKLADHFGIPSLLVINKCDLNMKIQRETVQFAQSENMPIVGLIPYDEEIFHAQRLGKPITTTLTESYATLFKDIWLNIRQNIFEYRIELI